MLRDGIPAGSYPDDLAVRYRLQQGGPTPPDTYSLVVTYSVVANWPPRPEVGAQEVVWRPREAAGGRAGHGESVPGFRRVLPAAGAAGR